MKRRGFLQSIALAFLAAPCWLDCARASEPEMPKAQENATISLRLFAEARDFVVSYGDGREDRFSLIGTTFGELQDWAAERGIRITLS